MPLRHATLPPPPPLDPPPHPVREPIPHIANASIRLRRFIELASKVLIRCAHYRDLALSHIRHRDDAELVYRDFPPRQSQFVIRVLSDRRGEYAEGALPLYSDCASARGVPALVAGAGPHTKRSMRLHSLLVAPEWRDTGDGTADQPMEQPTCADQQFLQGDQRHIATGVARTTLSIRRETAMRRLVAVIVAACAAMGGCGGGSFVEEASQPIATTAVPSDAAWVLSGMRWPNGKHLVRSHEEWVSLWSTNLGRINFYCGAAVPCPVLELLPRPDFDFTRYSLLAVFDRVFNGQSLRWGKVEVSGEVLIVEIVRMSSPTTSFDFFDTRPTVLLLLVPATSLPVRFTWCYEN